MSLWAILAAPLLMSHDLRHVNSEFRDILLNKKVIEINQDRLGIQGRRVFVEKNIEIWTRPVRPIVRGFSSYAVAFLNKRTDGSPFWVHVKLRRIGLTEAKVYSAQELYNNQSLIVHQNSTISVKIPPSGKNISQFNIVTPVSPVLILLVSIRTLQIEQINTYTTIYSVCFYFCFSF